MTERHPTVTSGRRLPSGRAVFGGLLVTLAVLAGLMASRLGDDAAFQDVVVARTDLTPGTVLGPDHVATVRIRLDESVGFVVSDVDAVYGGVLLGPVQRLEFIQRSNVADTASGRVAGGLVEVSVAIEPERAPARLAAGELVSILATSEVDGVTTTRLVADRVTVLSYLTDGDSFANDGILRLGLDDGDVAAAVVHAAQTGEISVVGVTGAPEVTLPRASP